jgi:hypothetical protein
MSKSIFKYDIESGHYILLNEDDNSMSSNAQEQPQAADQQSNQQVQKSAGDDENAQATSAKSIDSDTILINLNKMLNDKKVMYDREMLQLNNQLTLAKQDISNKMHAGDQTVASYEFDPLQVHDSILSLQNKIFTKEQEFNNFNTTIQKQILARKKALAAKKKSASEAKRIGVTNKVINLITESSVSKCKIYIDALCGEDMPIFNKHSLNRCFKNTNLVYGKDKRKYFVVIVDEDDVNEMYQALLDFGYDFEDIQSVILSGLMNRSHMI